MSSVRQRIERSSFFDAAVVRHGFVDYMRDYEILVAGRRPPYRDWTRYHFVGCVAASASSAIAPEVYAQSLDDEYVLSGPDYPYKDDPDGFVWGVRWASAYPGLSYIEGSPVARSWADRLGVEMHEVVIETNAFALSLVFHEFRYEALGEEPEYSPPKKDFPIPVV